jgi:hypothetical protein
MKRSLMKDDAVYSGNIYIDVSEEPAGSIIRVEKYSCVIWVDESILIKHTARPSKTSEQI